MDLNLYNIHFAVGLWGPPQGVKYLAHTHTNGIDTHGLALLEYPGFVCQCVGAKDGQGKNEVQIVGEKGCLRVTPGASNCQKVEFSLRGREPEVIELPENSWHYEMQAIAGMVARGDRAECDRLLEVSCQVARVLEEARRDAGLGF